MKSQEITVPPVTETWILSRSVLSGGGLEGSLTLLGPGVETPCTETPSTHERVLFVSEGSLTASVGCTHFILRQDETLHIPGGKTHSLRNHTGAPAKVLTITVPVPHAPAPTYVVAFP